jgi:hypothetical protein
MKRDLMGNGEFEISNKQWAIGNGQFEISNGQRGIDNRQCEMSNVQGKIGNWRKFFLSNFKCNSRFMLCILIIAFCQFCKAQQSIKIDEAIQIATTNSLKLKNEKLNAAYLNQLTKTAYDIPSTNISTELGQFNSNYFDAKIGVAQAIKFPVVYKKQKQVLVEEAKVTMWNEALQKKEIAQQRVYSLRKTQLFYTT